MSQITHISLFVYISPKSRACPRATHQGYAKCGGTSLCQWSGHRKKFRRKADKKIVTKSIPTIFWIRGWMSVLQIWGICNWNKTLLNRIWGWTCPIIQSTMHIYFYRLQFFGGLWGQLPCTASTPLSYINRGLKQDSLHQSTAWAVFEHCRPLYLQATMAGLGQQTIISKLVLTSLVLKPIGLY